MYKYFSEYYRLKLNGITHRCYQLSFCSSARLNSHDFSRFRLLWQVFEQIQRLVYTAGMAGMGRSYNELPLLQLQRQHERQEDKARLRVQPGLLPGPDSQRQRGFPQAEQTQFRPEAGDVGREFSGAARPGGLSTAILTSLLQCHHSSVSTTNFSAVFTRV